MAVHVITRTKRIYLLNELDVSKSSYLIHEMKDCFSSYEINSICSHASRLARVKTFLDVLSRKLTTEMFINFLIALGDSPEVRREILEAYEAEGGRT